MKHATFASSWVLLSTVISGPAWGGPVTKISAVSPRYNSAEIEITWEVPLAGGCTTSDFAVTNAGAANHQALVAFLLAAFSADASVEVIFGGGCGSSGSNWIQTVKLVRS